jgi:protoheme IX farnesyltransferase
MYRDDYRQAGYHMLPDFDRDARFTRAEIAIFTVILVLVTLLPVMDRFGWFYFAGMSAAGVFLLYHVGKLVASSSRVMASRLLHASVLYLPVVLSIMVAGKA